MRVMGRRLQSLFVISKVGGLILCSINGLEYIGSLYSCVTGLSQNGGVSRQQIVCSISFMNSQSISFKS